MLRHSDGRQVLIDPPEDMHFTATKLCLCLAKDPWQGCGHLMSAYFIVFLQLTVAWCLFSTMGNAHGACSSHGDCGRAMWCTITQHPRSSSGGMCLGCGFRDAVKQDLAHRFCDTNGTALGSALSLQQAVEEPDMLGTPQTIYMTLTAPDVSAMCEACTNSRGFMPRLSEMNLKAVGIREGVMYALVAASSSLCVMEEAMSLFKTLLYIHRATPPEGVSSKGAWGRKRRALLLLQTVRVFTLASVLMCVPLFILFDAADGVSILLNTVACLFILELDNFAFAYGVRELQRSELLTPFAAPLADAIAVERGKELVAASSLLSICLVGVGREWEASYLMVPWAFVIAACTVGEALITCHGSEQSGAVDGPGSSPRASSWCLSLVRLLVMIALTIAYPLAFSNATWWIPV